MRPHEIEQSQLTKARCITLALIYVAEDEQRQSSPCALMISHIWRECLAHNIECSAHDLQRFGIVDIFNVGEWGHFVLPILRAWQRGRSAVAPGRKKAPVPFLTFNMFVKIVSRASWPEPISEPSSRNGADGIKVPRSRISSALSHSRRTRAEMNDQTVIRQSATREGIDDKANDTLRAGHSHHAARNRFDNGANKPRRVCGQRV
jgi:hypothetical protein